MRGANFWWLPGFTVNAIAYILGMFPTFALCSLIGRLIAWGFSGQLKLMSFNEWFGYALLAFPIGIMAAGVMAVVAWAERTDAPLIKKIVVSLLICGLLAVGSVTSGKGIRLLLPIPSANKTVEVVTPEVKQITHLIETPWIDSANGMANTSQPSSVPEILGDVVSSVTQEKSGDIVRNAIQKELAK